MRNARQTVIQRMPGVVSKSKNWCFTVNNHTDDEEKNLRALTTDSFVSYLCYGREVGESGTPHLQGYLECSTRRTLRAVKALPGLTRSHLEHRRGSQDEAIEYCGKDGDFYEFGTRAVTRQGKRSDLDAIKAQLDQGASLSEIADANFGQWCYHRKAFAEYKDIKTPSSMRPDLEVFWVWGPTGVGKSRLAWSVDPDLFSVNDVTLKWFDGYQGQAVVLLDDYRGEASDMFILRLLDIYPMQVPVKGGFRHWHATKIWITSNYPPQNFHQASQGPLLRRIKKVIEVTHPLDFDDLTQVLTNFE